MLQCYVFDGTPDHVCTKLAGWLAVNWKTRIMKVVQSESLSVDSHTGNLETHLTISIWHLASDCIEKPSLFERIRYVLSGL